ncbi:hypothetical protein PR202_gb09376 [Eleusine coracana subsp. coracana]|uniref:Scarecrow-like protein 8 n=1 Tax=Eleusine coracana subsp. coracana TaxID=191504 RepID=A0AAV5EHE0_ELECO|nr:hypothetical protein PR202_gb09376 [Eleusine coracana subsp. coracana]
MSEMERWQQALYFRVVKQRTAASMVHHHQLDIGAASPRAGCFTGTPSSAGFTGLSPQPSSTLSSSLTTASRVATPPVQQLLQRQVMAAPSVQATAAAAARSATAREMVLLQELEKTLLGDDDEDEETEAAGSAVTNSGWGETTVQELTSITGRTPRPSHHPVTTATTPMSRWSPSDSTSSTTSSTASSSPPTSAASSRQLLSDAAAAVADGNQATAAAHLAVLKISANPRGDAEQRLVAMMGAALSSRVGPSSPPQHLLGLHEHDLYSVEHRAAWQLLHDVSPCFGLALHGANLAILDAAAGHRAVHVVDFDVSVAQHVALIQALPAGTSLRVTAVLDPTSPFTPAAAQALAATAERLKRQAQQSGVEFRFRAVSCKAEEVDASRLGCQPQPQGPGEEEALAVNLAFMLARVPDESVSPANPRDTLLRRVRALRPRVVTLVEQEASTNTAPLGARLADACAHYGAVLESLDATMARDSAHRARAERALSRKARNAVAAEGADRVERCEVFGKWRARFGMAGLRPVPLEQGVADRVRARLGPARPGFDVKVDNGRLGIGWMGRVVTVASAWC